MTTVVQEAPSEVTGGAPVRTPAAVLALALFEGRRLVLRAPVVVAFVGYVGWMVWRTPGFEGGFPALQDADRDTQAAPLLVALAVLLCVNHAALRSRRQDTERLFSVLPLSPGARTAAHALSLLPVAGLTALGVLGQFGYEALRPGAVGTASPAELLVGPLVVLLFGAVGVLLARLIPSVLAAPTVIVLFFASFVVGVVPMGVGERGTRWLVPIVGESSSAALPSDLLGRPAGWHALYLVGLALTLALLAVVRGGGRGLPLAGALAGALALAVTAGTVQTGAVSADLRAARARATLTPEKVQTCVTSGPATTRYCAYPEWTSRAATWAGIVGEVRAGAGGGAADQRLVVRQRVEARYGLDGDAALTPATVRHQVTAGTAWGGNRVPEFAVAVAGVLVAGDERAASRLCDGRVVTVMWLALNGLPDPVRSLRDVRLDDSDSGTAVVVSQTDPLSMTAAQTAVVRDALTRPRAEIAAKVKANWSELTAPKLTAARAATLLGTPAPEGKEADTCDA
ncbi:ABC transporter permease [Streptomyces sp. NPDC087212]|uniref:ABC transporter permease n=1 Tax=Streptomyces sp. NPDC087212 TaxID=3365766 RepID=UPI00380D1D0D